MDLSLSSHRTASTRSGIGATLRGRRLRKRLVYIPAIIAFVFMVSPYAYMLIQSLAPWSEVDRLLVPHRLTLKSYLWIATGGGIGTPKPWLRAFLNSVVVTTSDTLVRVAVAALTGYALSVIRFRGRKLIKNVILFQMFYPAIILLVPTFLLVHALGLYNGYGAMIVPMLVDVWSIFMYTNFFSGVATELVDSARMDGAGEFRIVFRIMLPVARSITTVIFLFLFMQRWVELLWDLLVVKDPQRQTLNVLLATMFGPYGNYPGPLYAAGVLLTFPILVLFAVFSRMFVEGVQFTLR